MSGSKGEKKRGLVFNSKKGVKSRVTRKLSSANDQNLSKEDAPKENKDGDGDKQ